MCRSINSPPEYTLGSKGAVNGWMPVSKGNFNKILSISTPVVLEQSEDIEHLSTWLSLSIPTLSNKRKFSIIGEADETWLAFQGERKWEVNKKRTGLNERWDEKPRKKIEELKQWLRVVAEKKPENYNSRQNLSMISDELVECWSAVLALGSSWKNALRYENLKMTPFLFHYGNFVASIYHWTLLKKETYPGLRIFKFLIKPHGGKSTLFTDYMNLVQASIHRVR